MFIENHPVQVKAPEERNRSSFAHKWAPVNKKARLFYKHRIPTGFPPNPSPEVRNGSSFAHKWAPVNNKA